MVDPLVLVNVERNVGYLTLNRPDKRNALTRSMIEQLLEGLLRFADDERVRVIALRGSGAAFCSGVDLADMQTVREQTGTFEFELVPELFERLAHHPKPTVAVVRGSAIAGGCELALHCDIRIGTPQTRLAMPLAKLGLVIPSFAAERLVQMIGLPAARDMLFTGDVVAGERAERIGLLSRIVADDHLTSAADAVVDTIARNAPLAVRAMKRVLDRMAPALSNDDHLEFNEERLRLSRSEDMREGLQAFFERRAPAFRGI